MDKRTFRLLAAVLTALALSGCADSIAVPESSTAPKPFAIGDGFLCGGLSVSREALETRVPLTEISAQGREALAAAVWDDGSPLDLPTTEGWYVATITDGLIGVMRDVEAEANPVPGGIPRDREVQTVTWMGDAAHRTPGWYGGSSGRCALTVDLGELTVPAITLQSSPDATSRHLRLLVTEQTCNSGEDALGRIEVVSLTETDERVSLVLGVRPRGGGTCPSNPTTPFTVTLSEPLGEREVVDAGLADPRPLTINQD